MKRHAGSKRARACENKPWQHAPNLLSYGTCPASTDNGGARYFVPLLSAVAPTLQTWGLPRGSPWQSPPGPHLVLKPAARQGIPCPGAPERGPLHSVYFQQRGDGRRVTLRELLFWGSPSHILYPYMGTYITAASRGLLKWRACGGRKMRARYKRGRRQAGLTTTLARPEEGAQSAALVLATHPWHLHPQLWHTPGNSITAASLAHLDVGIQRPHLWKRHTLAHLGHTPGNSIVVGSLAYVGNGILIFPSHLWQEHPPFMPHPWHQDNSGLSGTSWQRRSHLWRKCPQVLAHFWQEHPPLPGTPLAAAFYILHGTSIAL
ncbi:hypothetical protein NDU88_000601 [Pleurodeles waltl]|uniref:Uncharacterized protein n=1 Tax=Pleurodeles waltl TaxID=8319 RepID=A0AAV7WFZ3_PLEWA|nr:hypothetical protein NDU88_000601 [Pleurodeles waltl]